MNLTARRRIYDRLAREHEPRSLRWLVACPDLRDLTAEQIREAVAAMTHRTGHLRNVKAGSSVGAYEIIAGVEPPEVEPHYGRRPGGKAKSPRPYVPAPMPKCELARLFGLTPPTESTQKGGR